MAPAEGQLLAGALNLRAPGRRRTAQPAASEAGPAGWAEPHPVALRGLIPPTAVMLYAPRDEAELDVIERLVRASHAFARPA
jgi:hypothetical protein